MLDTRATTRCYYDSFGRRRCTNSTWSNWGRWVLLAIIVIAGLLFFMSICLLSKRRRRRGMQPYYGTGWAVGGNGNQPQNYQYGTGQQTQQNAYYQNNEAGYNNQVPQQPQYGNNYNQQGGYAETGVTPPKPAYGGEQQYAPPPGPPPNRY